MDLRYLALPAAILFGVIGYASLHHYSPAYRSDDGHGPAYGSPEWQAGIDHTIRYRSKVGAIAFWPFSFAAVFTLCPRPEWRE
jgi:hypothetical protein